LHPDTRPRILRALSARPGETAARWLRRAECQIAFARAFTTLRPAAETAEWNGLLDQAQAKIDGFDPNAGLFGLSAAVREAEALLAPIGQAAKRYTVHCVGHGHIDMNWMWSWPETVAATHDTFASVLSLMREYPDLTYSQSQASVYALVEKYYPEMFAEIRERVKEGRWEVSAVHWVEGDKNIASGESLCRHLLYTRRYFQEKFDLAPEDLTLDWEPDTFGHANTVPGILAQGGVKYYYSCRTGGGHEHDRVGDERPPLFWWEGPDGSRVLVNRETTWYNSYVNIGDNVALPAVDFWKQTGLTDWLNVYGIGNHGGGPTRKEIDYYVEMREWPVYPNVVFGTAKGWFDRAAADAAAADLPVIGHELNFEFTGCYTSQSLIKQANRLGENYCVEAEVLAALVGRTAGEAVPKGLLREAWLNVLFNQFHDILPGSGVRQTREHALGLFQETGAITGSIKRSAGRALVKNIDTLSLLPDTPEAAEERALFEEGAVNTPFEAGAGIQAMESGYSIAKGGGRRFRPVVIFNPNSWVRSEPVTVTLYDTDFDPGRIVARDEQGVSHPTQLIGRGHDWGHDKITLLFLARDIPALGYRTFVFGEGVADAADTPLVQAGPNGRFETPQLTLQYDRYQSGFKEVVDKRTGVRFTDPLEVPLGAWEKTLEQPRGMTAWVLGGETETPQVLRATHYAVHGVPRNGGTGNPLAVGSLAYRVEQVLEVPGSTQGSTVRLSALIHGLSSRVDVTAEVDWREIGDAKRGIPGLSVRCPFDLSSLDFDTRYETPFGSVVRHLSLGEEVPTLRYAHFDAIAPTPATLQMPCGFTLLQDGKYGHALEANDLRMRVIRSSFDPDHAPEVCRQTFRYSLCFHHDHINTAALTRMGADWNHPLMVLPVDLQNGDGNAAPARSFASVGAQDVLLTSLKATEDSDGLVLRLVEYNGVDAEAVVTLDEALTKGLSKATLADVMERALPESDVKPAFDGKTLTVPVRANSFVTVRLD